MRQRFASAPLTPASMRSLGRTKPAARIAAKKEVAGGWGCCCVLPGADVVEFMPSGCRSHDRTGIGDDPERTLVVNSGLSPKRGGCPTGQDGAVSTTVPPENAAPPAAAPARPPLVRPVGGRVLGGVAQGVATHLGVPVLTVRGLFAIGTLALGAGPLAYLLLWVFVPQDGTAREAVARATGAAEAGRPAAAEAARAAGESLRSAPPSAAMRWLRSERLQVLLVGVGLLLAALLVVATAQGFDLRLGITVPLLIVVVGAGVGLSQLDATERERWLSPVGGTGRAGLLRLGVGVVLVVTGVLLLVVPTFDLRAVTVAVVASLVVLAGVALVLAPWGVRLWRDLESERALRVRETERAEIAAHLHDSVLQTLALIQRRPGDAAEVARLARAQERDLRDWIYGADRVADGPVTTLREAVRAVCAEVEDAEGVPVEVILVGDATSDDATAAMVLALREALLNAVRHGRTGVSVYLECGPQLVEAFVRDRGPGFDLDTVPQDRLGVRRSIIDRMDRHGGRAQLRAAPGGGTEVALTLPRDGATLPTEAPGPVADHGEGERA